jgi:hypothetical protein
VNGLHAAGNTERLLPLVYSPAVLIITPRVYHKRLIKNPNVHIEREKPLAFWRDWSFVIVMTLGIGYLAAPMVWKTSPLLAWTKNGVERMIGVFSTLDR